MTPALVAEITAALAQKLDPPALGARSSGIRRCVE
jgi:hypothetical protein